MPLQGLLSDRMFVGRGVLDRVPKPHCSESPTVRAGVPRDLSLRRPRWWWPPRRRRSITGSITGRFITGRSITGWAPVVVVVPVTAAIPVLVRAPACVPLVARAPVMVIHRCRRRRRLGSARCQAERGQGHAASRQHASAQTKPRFLRVGIHALENSPGNAHKTLLVGSLNSNPAHSWDSRAVNISRRIPPIVTSFSLVKYIVGGAP
jgi:hypothetical protein